MGTDIFNEILLLANNKKIIYIRNLVIENNNKAIKIFWNKKAYIKNAWTMQINKATTEVYLNAEPTGFVSDILSLLSDWYDNINIEDWYYGA
jgi:hypothetical protein